MHRHPPAIQTGGLGVRAKLPVEQHGRLDELQVPKVCACIENAIDFGDVPGQDKPYLAF